MAGLPAWCLYSVGLAKEGLDQIRRILDPRNALKTDCRVNKHPDCCVLCALNNDCGRLPMHVRCRCQPEPFLTME